MAIALANAAFNTANAGTAYELPAEIPAEIAAELSASPYVYSIDVWETDIKITAFCAATSTEDSLIKCAYTALDSLFADIGTETDSAGLSWQLRK